MPKIKLSLEESERLPYTLYGYLGEHGRSRALVCCPFCFHKFEIFVWSLAGSGKRCPNCRAFFGLNYAYRDQVEVKK